MRYLKALRTNSCRTCAHRSPPTTSAAADGARAFAVERDLDEVAIERALAGDGVRIEQLPPAEQDEVVRRLTGRGKSIRDIGQQLATPKRTISRPRAFINAA